ncbi:unnamed protein product, partial [Meganyctiphanes norvegica]
DIKKCQESIDDYQKGKYYCVYFHENRYWGRLLKVFSHDDESVATDVELKFLHYKCGFWEFPKNYDIQIIETEFVFMGPTTPAEITKNGFKFNEDEKAFE